MEISINTFEAMTVMLVALLIVFITLKRSK